VAEPDSFVPHQLLEAGFRETAPGRFVFGFGGGYQLVLEPREHGGHDLQVVQAGEPLLRRPVEAYVPHYSR